MFQLYDAHGPIEAVTEDTAVTVGVFDGVHRGHQALLKQLQHTPSPLRGTPPNLGGELLPQSEPSNSSPKLGEVDARSADGGVCRYLRIVAEPLPEIPAWHRAAGQKAWIFTDEIIVK